MTVVASAPGKIVLTGEYAVLEGAPAVCMAVDRRARAEIAPARGDSQSIRASGCVDAEWRLGAGGKGSPDWLELGSEDDGLDLLREAWKVTGTAEAFDVSMDTSEFLDPASGSKLGLGSSAALTAALVFVLLRAAAKPKDVVSAAMEAHRRFQHGRGSGVDIAASLNGGIVEYRMCDSGSCRSLAWPAGLQYAVLWSGRAASTSDKLRKFRTARSGGRSGSVARLCDASVSAAKAWRSGETADLLGALHRYVGALTQFDIDHQLGIFDAGHGDLSIAASKHGVVYKPCGAGGGDIGMAFAANSKAIENFAQVAGRHGFRVLDVSLEADGVLIESERL